MKVAFILLGLAVAAVAIAFLVTTFAVVVLHVR